MRIVHKREIVLWVLMGIFTLGITNLIWIGIITEDMNAICDDSFKTSGLMAALFTFLTLGLYMIFWNYKMGQRLDLWHDDPHGLKGYVMMFLSVFRLDIICLVLLQDEINMRVDHFTAA